MPPKRLHKIQSGIAGEYLVAAELTRLGFVASLTLKNTQGIDVLASNPDGSKTVAIQVKCNQGTVPQWMLGAKADKASAKSLFYVFVLLNDGGVPDFHIVPSVVVAKWVSKNHREWLAAPGKTGKPHNDSSIRIFQDNSRMYRDKWESLKLG